MEHNTRFYQVGWLRRTAALVLAVSMVFTLLPPITLAAENYTPTRDSGVTITDFVALPDQVRQQTVPLGTGLDKLPLPDLLEVTIADDKQPPPVVDSGEAPPAENTAPPAEKTTPPEEDIAPSEEKATPPEEKATPPEEKATPPGESTAPSVAKIVPTAVKLVPSVAKTAPNEDEPAQPEPAPDEPSGEGDTADLTKISGVTWKSTPAYDGNVEGTYVFTPVLPGGYTVAEGVALPTITVGVAIFEAPELLLRPLDEENTSDLVLYFADTWDGYSWEANSGGGWRAMEGKTNPELRISKKEYYYSNYRCILTKNGSKLTSLPMHKEQEEEKKSRRASLFSSFLPESETSDYLHWYKVDKTQLFAFIFDLQGIDSGRKYATTYENLGYGTTSRVNGKEVKFGARYSDVAMGAGLYGDIGLKLVSGGRYLQITYTVRNISDTEQSFKIGSGADVMIGKNDRAPIQGAGPGRLTMTDGSKYQLNVIAPDASTLWYGHYTEWPISIFSGNDMQSDSAYSADSSMAFSWDGMVAPGGVWKKTALIGVGAQGTPPTFTVGPQVDKSGFIVGETITVSGDVSCATSCTVYASFEDGTTYELYTGPTGSFYQSIQVPAALPLGESAMQVWAVGAEGGTSEFHSFPIVLSTTPFVLLTDSEITVEEDTTLGDLDAYFRKYIKASSDPVSIAMGSFTTADGGDHTITYTVARAGYPPATATLKVTVLASPRMLAQNPPARVGVTDSFALTATLTHPGADAISETGFVWGSMQNPTTTMNGGKAATAVPVTTENGIISATAAGIVAGVDYYARAYAVAGGNVYYSDQHTFSIGGKNFGTFTIANNGNNVFTITRTGGTDDAQTVYYRTVNGSAVAGTHFTGQDSFVRIPAGSASATVTITERGANVAYDSNSATANSNADRTYQLEIYWVDGGAGIQGDVARATRSMATAGAYKIDRGIYNREVTLLNQSSQSTLREGSSVGIDPMYSASGATPSSRLSMGNATFNYFNSSGSSRARAKVNVTLDYRDSLWYAKRYLQLGVSPGHYFIYPLSGEGEGVPPIGGGAKYNVCFGRNDRNSSETRTFSFPNFGMPSSGTSGWYSVFATNWGANQRQDQQYVLFNVGDTPMVSMIHYQKETGFDSGYVSNVVLRHTGLYDDVGPKVVGVAPIFGTYKPGDQITLSVVFDEIVDSQNSSLDGLIANTSFGALTYAGGVDTNVLYFTGTVPANASTTTITLNSFNNTGKIRDMCNMSGSGGSKNGNIEVDKTLPTVSIANGGMANGTAKGTITAANYNTLKYAWSQSSAAPANGWINCDSGYTAQTRQLSGVWYLHAQATRSSNGASVHAVTTAFDFGTSANPTFPLPELTVAADNTSWAKSRTITVARKPAGATVTYTGPQSGTASGGTVDVTKNGIYTFTLTSGMDKVTQMVSVTKVDTAAPAITVTGQPTGTYGKAFPVSVAVSDVGGAGIRTVTGTWNKDGGGSQPAAGLTTTGGTVTSPDASGVWTLTVTATDNVGNTASATSATYTMGMEQPTVTVTKTGGTPKGDTYTYTVTLPAGVTLDTITLPDGSATKALTGSFTLTEEGTYYVTASDTFGHVVHSDAMTVGAGVDGTPPKVRLTSSTDEWVQSLTITANIFDNIEPTSGAYQLGSGTQTALDLAVDTAANVGNKAKNGTFDISVNGTYIVSATDAKDNTGTSQIVIGNIDTTAPTLTWGTTPTDWMSTAQNIGVTYSDNIGGSGVNTAEYAISGTNSGTKPTALTALPVSGQSVRVGTNGTNYIYYKVTDTAGNVTDGYSDAIKVDTDAPTLTIAGGTAGAESLELTVTSTFGTSSGTVTVAKDGGAAEVVPGSSYTVNAKGSYVFTATSGAGKTASVTKTIYGISFDSTGGSAITDQIVVSGGTATKPTDPTKSGYTLDEWQKNGTKYVFTAPVNGDTALAAVWALGAPTVSLAADDANPTYSGGIAATLTATPSHPVSGVTYAYEWYKGSDKLDGETGSTLELTTVAESGSYTAKVTADKDSLTSVHGVSNPVIVTIAKAPVTFVVTANVHDYDETPKTATVAQTEAETPSLAGSFTVSYGKDGNEVVDPTSVDIYDVVVDITDPNFKHKDKADSITKTEVGTLTINSVPYPKAEIMTWPTSADLTYGETLGDSALTGGSETLAQGTYAWKFLDTVPTVQNDGYVVVFTPANINWSTVEHTTEITVAKATPIVAEPTAEDITYGDKLAGSDFVGGSASWTVGGVANTDVPGKFSWTTPGTMPKVLDSGATDYDITFTPTDTANYHVVTTSKIKLAVGKKAVGLKWAGHTGLTYNGAPVSVTATATDLVPGDSCAVTVIDGTETNAGDYTAKATAVGNDNYKLPTNSEQAYTIAKKPLKVLWSDMFPTYDGSSKKPTVALVGVVGGEDCTVLSTGSAAAGNAGRYRVAAALQGANKSNYTIANPNDILVIQPKPVAFTLTDYSHKYDDAPKVAIVTPSLKTGFTVTYRQGGKEIAAPTAEGIYDIFVGLDSTNYRHADGADGKPRKLGALTIYKEKPPELYTITFASGAGDAVGKAATLPPSVKDTVHILPSNTFLRSGYAFVGWKKGDTIYQQGDSFVQPANSNTVFTAQWKSSTYDIGGVVDQGGNPMANVRVVLMRGAEQVAETVTDQLGEYHFSNILPGLYNLVATKPSPDGVGDIIMTIMVDVKTADVDKANITLPSGKTNSIVDVAPGTPKIIVGNLDQTFKNTTGSNFTPQDQEIVIKGGTVEIKFIAEEKKKSEVDEDAKEIAKQAGRAKIGLYLSLDVEKTVTQPPNPANPDAVPTSATTSIPETSVLLESVIPLPTAIQGMQSYTIYRMHDGTVDTLTDEAVDGERIEVNEDKTTLTLYAQKFSTYAIAYTEMSSGSSDDDSPVGGSELIEEDIPGGAGEGTEKGPTSDNGGNADNGSSGSSDPSPEDKIDDLNRAKDDALKKLAIERQKAIDALPDYLTAEQRQKALDEIERIYTQAVADIKNADSKETVNAVLDKAIRDFAAVIAGLGDELPTQPSPEGSGNKPFVLLSAVLAAASIPGAVLAWRRKEDEETDDDTRKRARSSVIAAAAAAILLFLLTTGWSGITFANWWTLGVAVCAAVPVRAFVLAKKK